jgi:hypothetical protein
MDTGMEVVDFGNQIVVAEPTGVSKQKTSPRIRNAI